MKHRYSAFDVIVMTGFVLIMAAMAVTIFIKNTDSFEILVSLGVWIIVSFFILVLMHGTIRGVARHKIKIPKGLAMLIFGISGALFFSAWVVSNT